MGNDQGVACFQGDRVKGEVLFTQIQHNKVQVDAYFTTLPAGEHGFHIHRAGDLRGEGCMGACEHYHRGRPMSHGRAPSPGVHHERHTGDLGNIIAKKEYQYIIHANLSDLFGRSVIVHADPDDLGQGEYEDSKTTGHSGARIGCALIGRAYMAHCPVSVKGKDFSKTRKTSKTKSH